MKNHTTDRDSGVSPVRSLAAGEEGMVALLSLVVVFAFLLILCAVLNTGWVVTRKVEAQNAADAAAQAAGVEMARGMNAITAANHLIGELTALVVLHHALGGDELDGLRKSTAKQKQEDEKKAKDKPADDDAARPNPILDAGAGVDASYNFATGAATDLPTFLQPREQHYNAVKEPSKSGAAINSSRTRLKKVITLAYIVHGTGGVLWKLKKVPGLQPVGVIGLGMAGLATGVEWKVYQEWLVLKGMEAVAESMVPAKFALMGAAVVVHQYTKGVVLSTPAKAEEAARLAGERNGAAATLYPAPSATPLDYAMLVPGPQSGAIEDAAGELGGEAPPLRLPVRQEPMLLLEFSPLAPFAADLGWWDLPQYKLKGIALDYAYLGLRAPARSQLVRATTPWVQRWRLPVYAFADVALTLSHFKEFYQVSTNTFTQVIAGRLKLLGVNLYVLEEMDLIASDKGQEPWTTDSRRADQLFSVVAFARREPAPVTGLPWFRQANPDGVVAYAQAMVYNANPQLVVPGSAGPRTTPNLELLNLQSFSGVALIEEINKLLLKPELPPGSPQPPVGWDTLNWGGEVLEHPGNQIPRGPSPVPWLPRPPGSTLVGGFFRLPEAVEPAIRLNWQTKLVPTTRLKECAPHLEGAVKAVLDRLPKEDRPLDSTH